MFTEVESKQEEPRSKVLETASIRSSADKNEVEVKKNPSENSKESFQAVKEISYLLKRRNPPIVSYAQTSKRGFYEFRVLIGHA